MQAVPLWTLQVPSSPNPPLRDRPLLFLHMEDDRTVKALSRFADGQELVKEYLACDLERVLGGMRRDVRHHDREAYEEAWKRLRGASAYPDAFFEHIQDTILDAQRLHWFPEASAAFDETPC